MTKKSLLLDDIHFAVDTLTIHGLTTNFSSSIQKKSDDLVLCLHGWLDNAASFVPLLNCLKECNVIAIDLPGHGKSSHKSHDAHYHFIDWVYDVLRIIEVNKWQNIHLVGHSMGGMIASAFTAAFPDKVKSLTLIDSMGFLCIKEQEFTNQLRKGMLSRTKSNSPRVKKAQVLTREKAIKSRVLISDLSYEHAELIVSRNIEDSDLGVQWRSDKKLNTISPYRLTLAQAEQLISDIKVPTQLIYGNNGLDFVQDGIETFSLMIDDFTCEKLGGGHHIHMENPKATSILIKSLINKTDT